MNKEIITSFINCQCTSNEVDDLIKWFKDKENSIQSRQLLKQIWNETRQTDRSLSVKSERILDSIHHDINLARPVTSRKKFSHRFISVFSRIAAVLFIPLFFMVSYSYIRNDGLLTSDRSKSATLYTEVTSPMGSITFMELPDGSKVWLNHGSRLKFPQRFTGKTRTVKLSGEGYFQIAHNNKKPFIVEAGEIQALVKGTEFDMMAYPEDAVIETTLKSGKLILQRKIAQKTVQDIFEMIPGNHVKYLKQEKKLIYSIEDPDKYISWINGKLVFKHDSFDEIAKKLSRWYNVDIQLEDEELSQHSYSATFVDETLTQVLELLAIATPIKYTMSARKKLQDGTFSRRKVIIQLKCK